MSIEAHSLPPHAAKEEQAALGCVLLTADETPDEAARLFGQLRLADFYVVQNRTIYSAMQSLLLEDSPLSTTHVLRWLKDKRQLGEAGNSAYVFALTDEAPSPVAFESYLPMLHNKATRRELIHAAGKLVKDAENESLDANDLRRRLVDTATRLSREGVKPDNWIKFYTPSECRDYTPPAGHILVGDSQIVRGAVTVIGGAAGVGKSRAAIALAISGATGKDWLSLKVHSLFKTMVVQNENGRYRLSKDFSETQGDNLDASIRICEPPANGMAFDRAEFRAALSHCVREFKPDVVILDPWNSAARDDRQKDYIETFQLIREVLPNSDDAPALVIVAHTRKPRADERASGRGLLNLLAGSYVLGSVPRCVFVMQPASEAGTDERIVWTCCKNNDGKLGERSAWYRRDGLFEACPDFDWKIFDDGGEKRKVISLPDLDVLFDGGKRQLPRNTAAAELEGLTGLRKTACYEALKLDGKFASHLAEQSGVIVFTP